LEFKEHYADFQQNINPVVISSLNNVFNRLRSLEEDYPQDVDDSGKQLTYQNLPATAKSDVDIWKHINTQIMGKDYEKYGLYTPANPNAINLRIEKLEDEHANYLDKKEVESVIESYHGDDIERIEGKFSDHTKNHNGGGFNIGGLFGGLGIGAIAALGLGLYIVTRKK
tara:strand:+ start:63 stop:569 length:507 start_codon:yes stop_codon:yes gene_type:complete